LENKNSHIIILCPACEWISDDEIHWTCSCGHRWNTFDTKAKCPNCGIQWENTRCPACGESTPHKDWYKTIGEIELLNKPENDALRARKKNLEIRLINYGIKNYRVSHLPYLIYENEKFRSTYEAGCRMIILYAIAYVVHSLEERPGIVNWLKEEKIWDKVSPQERDFFSNEMPDERTLMNLSWRIESALTLGWCLGKVKNLSPLDTDNNEKELEEFQLNVPELGKPLKLFLTTLQYRDLKDVYEENLLNEIATSYFRDLLFNEKKDETKINRFISFERHLVLNWLRTFMGNKEWDETDTST